jgi:hypothetical protein
MMKNVVLIILIVFGYISLKGQSDKNKIKNDLKNIEFYNGVFGDVNDTLQNTTIPEEWKEESFVFLDVDSYITIGSKGKKFRGINRKRVLLQDKNAVNNFSEFYFHDAETTILTILKKDGQQVDVNLTDAVKVTTQVPKIYSGRFQSSTSSKLVIPNLEVGDILDYTSIYNADYKDRIAYLEVLSSSVPILSQRLVFDVKRDFDVYRNTFNTSSKFILEQGVGHDYEGKLSEDMNRFSLEVSQLKAQEEEPLSNTYQTYPMAKLMFISKGDKAFHSGKDIGVIKDHLELEYLVRQYYESDDEETSISKDVVKYIKPNIKGQQIKETKKIVDACYYYIRDYFMMSSYAPDVVSSMVGQYGMAYESIYNGFSNAVPAKTFISAFSSLVKQFNLDFEIVGVVPNNIGGPLNAVTHDEVYFGVYVPSTKLYYWPPDRDRTHLDTPMELTGGAEGKSYKPKSKSNEISVNDVSIKPTVADDNVEDNILKISIDQNNNITVVIKTISSGTQKNNCYEMVEQFGDNLFTDFLSMYSDDYTSSRLLNYNFILDMDTNTVYKSFLEKSDINFSDNVRNWIKREDKKAVLYAFELKTSGRTFLNPIHDIEAKFKSDGFIKKLGPNLIFDIGTLIDDQIQIEIKHKTSRLSEIDLGYPRYFHYLIGIELPADYKVDNLQNLIKSKENEYASFTSSATIEDNTLFIETAKKYKQHFVAKEHWAEVVEVLDEAYEFSQEKIVLKKK